MLEIKGSQEFIKRLKRDHVNLEKKAAETHRRIIKHIFTDLVTLTPQWSGNLASNWVIEFSGVKGSYKQAPNYTPPNEFDTADMDQPLYRGHPLAVDYALDKELPKLAKIRYNTKVTIKNYTPYAEDVEMGIGPPDEFGVPRDIREVNILKSYGSVAMKGYIEMKYSNLRMLKSLAV